MKIIRKNMTLPGFSAIFLFGVLFISPNAKITDRLLTHETIHSKQYNELLYIGLIITIILSLIGLISWWWLLISPFTFYILYGIEWLFEYICTGFNARKAYRNMSFEREAYFNEHDLAYTHRRRPLNFLRYI